jgi:hypothetical protein
MAFHSGIDAVVARRLAVTPQFSHPALLARRPRVLTRSLSRNHGLVQVVCVFQPRVMHDELAPTD